MERRETAPASVPTAHSKSQYKRLVTQGAIPASDTPIADSFCNEGGYQHDDPIVATIAKLERDCAAMKALVDAAKAFAPLWEDRMRDNYIPGAVIQVAGDALVAAVRALENTS